MAAMVLFFKVQRIIKIQVLRDTSWEHAPKNPNTSLEDLTTTSHILFHRSGQMSSVLQRKLQCIRVYPSHQKMLSNMASSVLRASQSISKLENSSRIQSTQQPYQQNKHTKLLRKPTGKPLVSCSASWKSS